MNIFKKFGLREVINASGKMTMLGGSVVPEPIGEDMRSALGNFVIIDELIDYTGKIIAEFTGAQAGCPTLSAAAGVAISVAAVIAGEDLTKLQRLPNSEGLKNEIIIQKGHAIDFGGSILQMIALGGGKPVEIGLSNGTKLAHLEGAITEKTAAIFYVKSHHTVQKGMLSLTEMIAVAKEHNLPVIVDAAAEEDFKKHIKLGPNLVIYSGSKALGGPTSGFICGDADLIQACKWQYKGIGRAMKISKELMVGLISGISNCSVKTSVQEQKDSMENICKRLNSIEGLFCKVVQDDVGREVFRAQINIDEKVSAKDVAKKLESGAPAIFLRDHYINQNILLIDPRPLFEGQAGIILERLIEIMSNREIS